MDLPGNLSAQLWGGSSALRPNAAWQLANRGKGAGERAPDRACLRSRRAAAVGSAVVVTVAIAAAALHQEGRLLGTAQRRSLCARHNIAMSWQLFTSTFCDIHATFSHQRCIATCHNRVNGETLCASMKSMVSAGCSLLTCLLKASPALSPPTSKSRPVGKLPN